MFSCNSSISRVLLTTDRFLFKGIPSTLSTVAMKKNPLDFQQSDFIRFAGILDMLGHIHRSATTEKREQHDYQQRQPAQMTNKLSKLSGGIKFYQRILI